MQTVTLGYAHPFGGKYLHKMTPECFLPPSRPLLLGRAMQLSARRWDSFSLIHAHGPCPGALVHHFILPAQLSLSLLKPSLTHCCHNKPTLAVSPQHPPAFAFPPLNPLQHTHPNSHILTPTIHPPLFYSHSLTPSSLKATCKPWFIFKPWFSFRTQILHFIQHVTKSGSYKIEFQWFNALSSQ